MKIVIGIPHYNMFTWDALQSLLFMVKRCKHEMHIVAEMSPYIHKSRNSIFKEAQNVGADYLLMIDCDMKYPHGALQQLIDLDKDIACGMYYKRAYPHYPLAYEWTGNPSAVHRNIVDIPTIPFKVDSVGTGFMLISKKVLDAYTPKIYKEHGKPFNHKIYDDDMGGDTVGEDTSFCLRMRDLGHEIWIDPTFDLRHIGTVAIESAHWELGKKIMLENEGWTTEEELAFLAETAKGASNIVEIGSWKGRSTKALLGATQGTVHAVDHFNGSITDKSSEYAKFQDVYKQFMENVGHYKNLKVYKMDSVEASMVFEDNSLDMVFIDADHSHEGCSRDITAWLPKLKKGGIICGHDYGDCSGVTCSVDRLVGEVSLVGSIWYKEVA